MTIRESLRLRHYPVAAQMLVGLAAIIMACFALAWWMDTSRATPISAQLTDLSDATFVEIRTLGGEVAMSGELRDHVDGLGNVEKDAALLGAHSDRVIGEVEIEIPREGASDPRQELEVDVISLEPSTAYQVVVNDRPVATFNTDDRGSVDVEFLSAPRNP